MLSFRRTTVPRRPAAAPALLALLLLAAGGASPAAASSPMALGDGGEIYRAVAGRYGDLFPDGAAAAPATPVLALEIARSNEETVRRLVPGSEAPGVDGSAALVFEADSGTVFAIWESRSGSGSSSVWLAGLRKDLWTEPFELSGDVDPLKGAPLVLITRDRYAVPTVADGLTERKRSVLHAVWWERAAGGEESIQYTPVVLEAGAYVGWNPVYRLNDLDPSSPEAGGAGADEALYSAPSLSAGKDLHTVMVAFGNRETDRLLTVEARVLPGELGLIADRLHGAVIAAGYDDGPDRLRTIRGILRAEIIEIGIRFNPGVTSHFAQSVVDAAQALHDARPHRGIRAFAGDLRAEIIEIGVQVLGDVDRQVHSKATQVLEVADAAAPAGATVPSVVRLRLVRDLPAPASPAAADGPDGTATGSGQTPGAGPTWGPAKIFASEDGLQLLVAWETAGELIYTESLATAGHGAGGVEADAWTEPRSLALGEGESRLSADDVERILRSRVQRRP